MEELYRRDADYSAQTNAGDTAFHYAAWGGHEESFNYCVQLELSATKLSNTSMNPMMTAAMQGQWRARLPPWSADREGATNAYNGTGPAASKSAPLTTLRCSQVITTWSSVSGDPGSKGPYQPPRLWSSDGPASCSHGGHVKVRPRREQLFGLGRH
jgi:hypothetical protein